MENKTNVVEKKEYFILEIFRFIACIGVFNGHFLSIALKSDHGILLYELIRKTWINKTILVYLVSGDISVLFFFALGGFLSSYNIYRYNRMITWKRILIKELYLAIPSLIIIIIGATISMIKDVVFQIDGFKWVELLRDFRKILIGGLGEDIYPYYSYQLWYINNAIICVLFVHIIILLSREHIVLRYILYILLGLAFWKYSLRMDIYIMGAMAGEFSAKIQNKGNNSKKRLLYYLLCFIGIIPLLCLPLAYHEGHQKTINIWGGGILFVISITAIVLACEYNESKKVGRKSIFGSVIRNSYSIYLVHVLIIGSSSFVYGKLVLSIKEEYLVYILYVFYFLITILMAEMFRRIVITSVRKIGRVK